MSPRPKPRHRVVVTHNVPPGVTPPTIRRWVSRGAGRLRLPAGTITVAFLRPADSRGLNRRYRRKDRPTNILSFRYRPALEGVIGELLLCPAVIRTEVPRTQYQSRVRFLLEHGLIHLLGLDHQTSAQAKRWAVHERRLSV